MSSFGISTGGAIQGQSASSLAADLDLIQAAAAKWVRIDLNWAQIEASTGTFNYAAIDAVVSGATKRGLKVLGMMGYSPSWAAASWKTFPSPSIFGPFCQAAAKHYAALGVHAYEIWNEQNTLAFCASPSPSAYVGLLKAAYPAIKAADPSATVITGGLSPSSTDGTNYSPVDFLTGVYAAGGKGYFDAVGHHPYCWPANPGDAQGWSAWYQMYGAPTSLRTIMSNNGDSSKQIWATEFGAPSNGQGGVSEEVQASMISKAGSVWSGYSASGMAWPGPLFVFQHRDAGDDVSTRENFFGLVNVNGTPKPALAAFQAVSGA